MSAEEITEFGDGFELLVVDGGGGVFDGAGEEVEGVDYPVFCRYHGLGEVVMEDLDGVGDLRRLGGGVDHAEAAVVVEGWADDVAFAAAVVP